MYIILIYFLNFPPHLFIKKPKTLLDLKLLPAVGEGSPKGVARILEKQRLTREPSVIFRSATRSASNDERPPVHSAVVHHS